MGIYFFASLKLVGPWFFIWMKLKFDSLTGDPEMAYYSTDIEQWKLPVFEIDKSFVKTIMCPLFYCSPGYCKFLQIDLSQLSCFSITRH